MNRVAISGFEELYEVDDCGNVYSIRQSTKKLKPYKVNGYLKVRLYNGGKVSRFFVHRLVAEAFIPNPDNLPEVNHKDCDHANNHVSNLEWVSREQNIQHSYDNGLKRAGELHGMHKLNADQVRQIRSSTLSNRVLSKIYGVHPSTIWSIKARRLWKGVI